jgi:hypothetical protein
MWALVGVIAIDEFWNKRRERKKLPRILDLELQIEDLKRSLKEQRKGANEFGRIIP